jgi:hypothetical protein
VSEFYAKLVQNFAALMKWLYAQKMEAVPPPERLHSIKHNSDKTVIGDFAVLKK